MDMSHTSAIFTIALALDLYWLCWIGFLMAMQRSSEMAHRCMMDAVENSTSRKSQIGQRNSGRGQSESKDKTKGELILQDVMLHLFRFFFQIVCHLSVVMSLQLVITIMHRCGIVHFIPKAFSLLTTSYGRCTAIANEQKCKRLVFVYLSEE